MNNWHDNAVDINLTPDEANFLLAFLNYVDAPQGMNAAELPEDHPFRELVAMAIDHGSDEEGLVKTLNGIYQKLTAPA